MSCVRAGFLASSVVAVATLGSISCGGASAPVTPNPPTAVLEPTPAPDAGGGGASANTCPIGQGDPTASCGPGSPQLVAAVEAAIDRLVREQPGLFNLQEEAGPGQYRVLAPDAYLDGVVANLRAAGHCAERTLNRERVVLKSSNAFSEEWDILTARGFIRRGSYAYQQTCRPAVFPVAPADLISHVRVAFFSFECEDGVVATAPPSGQLRLACSGFVTASPKLRNGENVPPWIHGPDIEWDFREGQNVVNVAPDLRFRNEFNKRLYPTGDVGTFVLCATVLGKTGCLNGRTIP